MDSFSLNNHLEGVYNGEAFTKIPVIGITSNYENGDATLREKYYKQVVAAGGTPLIIAPTADRAVLLSQLDKIDGLLLTGGGDFNPLWGGEEPSPLLHSVNAERDLPELLITRLAANRQLPILGICRGMQTIALALGGRVAQDISLIANYPKDKAIKHSQDADRDMTSHHVDIVPESMLADIYKTATLAVNSFHHQAVVASGPKFNVSATAPDGVIEAIESSEMKAIIGVQWHPEWLGEEGGKLFCWLVEKASLRKEAHELHDKIITLDSHCDTPMFFSQNINFFSRDNQILVDYYKMQEGMLDVTTMVSYLPQPKSGETFAEKVPFKVQSPREYADLLFDKIDLMIAEHPDKVAHARNITDIWENKQHGLKSIMIGIENGLAIENDIRNIEHFAQRGIMYITLCHNGDNDICDSARGSETHGGVSDFGAEVIREMNRLGVAVDLSHAAESSFYDAIDISSQPIVCSHSNCKSLCDVPRNLTDDQLRALAKNDGVVQITLYHGFLKKESEASILDAMDHLEHAINIVGIDHVGLGSDFDGDGGVRGIADASEMINFTMQLLSRRYNPDDIRMIWGENWLRRMRR